MKIIKLLIVGLLLVCALPAKAGFEYEIKKLISKNKQATIFVEINDFDGVAKSVVIETPRPVLPCDDSRSMSECKFSLELFDETGTQSPIKGYGQLYKTKKGNLLIVNAADSAVLWGHIKDKKKLLVASFDSVNEYDIEFYPAKLQTSSRIPSLGRIISSEIISEDGNAVIHLDYQSDGVKIDNVTISVPKEYLFCNPQIWGRTISDPKPVATDDCPSDMFYQYQHTGSVEQMGIVMPLYQHIGSIPRRVLPGFIVAWELGADKFYFEVYNKYGDKFSVAFFKRNLIYNFRD